LKELSVFLFSVAKPVGGLPLQLNAPIEVFVHYDELIMQAGIDFSVV
jgi:hypothetical protein